MILYLLRHGDALPASLDPERPLSSRGREQIRRIAALARERRIRFDRVHASPLLRARESASTFLAGLAGPLDPTPGIGLPDPTDELLPAAPVEPWVARTRDLDLDLLLVGHNPFLEELAGRLVPGARLAFETGALIALQRNGGGEWSVLYRLDPEAPPEVRRTTA